MLFIEVLSQKPKCFKIGSRKDAAFRWFSKSRAISAGDKYGNPGKFPLPSLDPILHFSHHAGKGALLHAGFGGSGATGREWAAFGGKDGQGGRKMRHGPQAHGPTGGYGAATKPVFVIQ